MTEPAYDEKDEIADLWIFPGDGSAPPRRLTTAKGKEASPAWSPDGTQVAYSAKREADEVSQIHVIAAGGGEARRLTQLALGARSPQWSPDGKTILFQASVHRGATNDAVNKSVAEERKKAKSKVRIYDGFPVRRWDKWPDDVQTHLFVMPADSSAENYRVDLASARRTRLTRFNVEAAAAVDSEPLREFWFTNTMGRSIHSFLALPPPFDDSKKYPMLVLIHGGHASMWQDSITRRWNYHLLAQPGYVVLLTDYVGSTGYGEKFTRDILGDPLRGPADDINAAADEAIRRFAFIDGDRLLLLLVLLLPAPLMVAG